MGASTTTGAADGSRRRYREVRLPLMSAAVEQTENTAVFLKSPNTSKRQRRERLQTNARRGRSPTKLASMGLRRAASAPAALNRAESEECTALAEWCGVGSSPVASFRGDVHGEGRARSKEDLHAGIMRRANEQTMVANLKQLSVKQRLRCGHCDAGTPRMRRRQQVGATAAAFTEMYGKTVGILEEHMTLTPPCRCHSLMGIDLSEYDTPPSSESPVNRQARDRAITSGAFLGCGDLDRGLIPLPGQCDRTGSKSSGE